MDKFLAIAFAYVVPMMVCLGYWFDRARRGIDFDYLGEIAFSFAFIPGLNWIGVLAVTIWSLMDSGVSLAEKVRSHE